MAKKPNNLITHPTSVAASHDRIQDRENLARQLRSSQMQREMAREQINATQLLSEIGEIAIAMEGESEQSEGNMSGLPIPMDRDRLAQLKAQADIKFRLLDKVLPNLKATESVSHSVHDHNHQHAHAHTDVTNIELAQRLQLWRRGHQEELRATEVPVAPAPAPRVVTKQPDETVVYDFL